MEMMVARLLLIAFLPGFGAVFRHFAPRNSPGETVIIDCPGLRCAACQLGVIKGSKAFAGVRSVDFDPRRGRLTLTVEPGFDRHHELIIALQHVAEPIEMFRATLVEPRQVFLYLDRPVSQTDGTLLSKELKTIRDVKSVYRDERGVFSLAIGESANRAEILQCVQALGYRGEIFETRYEANLESRISEESHHLIGIVILVMSFLIIFDHSSGKKHGAAGAAISILWILGGVLVLLFSDLDSWPFVRTLSDSLRDKMIVQHKILGTGMVLLGVAELRRRRERGWRYGPLTLFLAVSVFSGVMLQYHFPDMVDPAHLKAWESVNRQHLVAAIVGGAALVARAAQECHWIRWPKFAYAWPILLGLEGALLCIFMEPVW